MKQYRKLLLEKCLGSLQGQVSSSAMAEGMEALTKVLAELREGDIGSSFETISKQCRAFFDNVSPDKSLPNPHICESSTPGGGGPPPPPPGGPPPHTKK